PRSYVSTGHCRRTCGRAARPEAAPSSGASAALDGLLERAAGRELRDAGRRNLHLLLGVARVDACPRCALLCLELAETRERDVAAALERVGNRFEEGVDRLRRVACGEPGSPRDLVRELLLRHLPLLLSA